MYLLTTKLRVYNSIEFISNDDTDVCPLDLGAVEPDVGVDDDDVPRVEDCTDNSPTGPPALRGRPKVPGLTARYLGLPGGHVHVINVEVSSGPRGSDEDPRLLRRSGVWVEEVRTTVEMMELLGHGFLADCPAHVPQGVPHLLTRHPGGGG